MQMIYRNDASIEDLEIGECTMHRAITSGGSRYWHMWFRANRETDGQPFDFCVPMNPNGNYTESGVGGKTWGARRGFAWRMASIAIDQRARDIRGPCRRSSFAIVVASNADNHRGSR